MPKQKRLSKKKIDGKGRLDNAKKWLSIYPQKDLIFAYSKRYGVSYQIAEDELITLGYYDEICIQHYEKEGVEWEYRVEPLSGEMVVVPKDSEERQIYELYGVF